jgi:hypothetical protein
LWHCSEQVLKDETTLEDNKITHENFVVVMTTRVRKLLQTVLAASHSVHSAHTPLSTCSQRSLLQRRRRSSHRQPPHPPLSPSLRRLL